MDNVILTPHIGSYAKEARIIMETDTIKTCSTSCSPEPKRMALSLIVFDCDGVILESVDAKTKAFGRWRSRSARKPATGSSSTIPCTAG